MTSRAYGTALLAHEILKAGRRAPLICASGTNFYGYERDDPVDERSTSGNGFLAEVCRRWEGAGRALEDAGIRTVYVRTGMVLSAHGGALPRMLPVFKSGVGGRIGSAEQQMSWISLPDLVAVYRRAIEDTDLSGPINAVAPKPVRNREFTRTLAHLLHRPSLFPVPAGVVRILVGQMGRETLLADLAVIPRRLREAGFQWQTPSLYEALSDCIRETIT